MTYTDAELCEALRAFDDEEGHPPTVPEANARDGFPHSQTFVYRFGSWNAALDAAGLGARNRRRTDEELLADLRKCADDEYPSYAVVAAREDMVHPETYRVRFGTWNAAHEAAGLPVFDHE